MTTRSFSLGALALQAQTGCIAIACALLGETYFSSFAASLHGDGLSMVAPVALGVRPPLLVGAGRSAKRNMWAHRLHATGSHSSRSAKHPVWAHMWFSPMAAHSRMGLEGAQEEGGLPPSLAAVA